MIYLLPPLLGGLIGLFTNWLAILMLFRPHKGIRILGHRLPLTPGLIPKDQNKLAQSIGLTVNERLVNAESLHQVLTEEKVRKKILLSLGNLYQSFGFFSYLISPRIKNKLSERILALIYRELPKILEEVDIQRMVSKKIEALSMEEIESTVLAVAKKELLYITLFGGLLGFLVGAVQSLVFYFFL